MNRPCSLLRICLIAAAALASCAKVDPHGDYRQVDDHVRESTGLPPIERPEDAAAVAALIDERLAGGLSLTEALEICLLGNPRVRAAYLRVGVARAEVVQAGLFQNPTLSLSLRLPDGGGLSNLELAIAQNIADLWLIPARRRAAEGRLQHEVLTVAREIGAAALDARAAYFTVAAADREMEIATDNRAVAQSLMDATQARREAGVGSEIDVNLARAEHMQTELAVQTASLAAFDARRRLCVLLGLATPPDELKLLDPLPEPTTWPLADSDLVSLSQRTRLDLVAAGYLVEAAAAQVDQERLSVFSDVQVGVSFERAERGRRGDRTWLADTAWASAEAGQPSAPSLRPREDLATDTVLGPTLALELPIFDQNQAQIAKAEFLHQTARANRDALALETTQETRIAARRARTAWETARYYRENILPLVEDNLKRSRDAYQGGSLSLLAVLEAQKSLLTSRRRYLDALRDFALALTDLEKVVGLPIERIVRATVEGN